MRLLINPLYPNDDYSCHGPLLAISALYPATTECVVITCNRKSNKAQGLSLEIALEVYCPIVLINMSDFATQQCSTRSCGGDLECGY